MYSFSDRQTANQQSRNNSSASPDRKEKTIEQRKASVGKYTSFHHFGQLSIEPKLDSPIQAKLMINAAGDQYEREADRVAEQVMQKDGRAVGKISTLGAAVQRKCAACASKGATCSKCKEEEEGHIQPKAQNHSPKGAASGPLVNQIQQSKGKGQPMAAPIRTFMEQRFGVNFGQVRIHTDDRAAQMNQQIQAKAFTQGQDIYFNRGNYQTNLPEGKKLLAHELTHTLQQSGNTIRRQEDVNASSTNSTSGSNRLIVENNTAAIGGQMEKSVFLGKLSTAICTTVDQELLGTPYSSDHCPYIKNIFTRLRNSPAEYIERLLIRYESSAATAQNALELIQLVLVRVRRAVRSWKRRKRIGDVPEDVVGLISELNTAPQDGNTESRPNRNVQFKAKTGGTQSGQSPISLMHSLGKGQPLQAGVRGRMEKALGISFSDVEIHKDHQAARLSGNMNARAFTVGNHIAFNSGEYQPGTLIGDALLAHELAHVSQQQTGISNSSQHQPAVKEASLEREADLSAAGAVFSLWGGWKGLKNGLAQKVIPRMRSGLQVQRCKRGPSGIVFVESCQGGGTATVGTGARVGLGSEVAVSTSARVSVSGGEAALSMTARFGSGNALTMSELAAPAMQALHTTGKITAGTGVIGATGIAIVESDLPDTICEAFDTPIATETAMENVLMASAGNVADTGIMEEVHNLIDEAKQAGRELTICQALAELMVQAKQARDKARIQRIKATQKAHKCRKSRPARDRK